MSRPFVHLNFAVLAEGRMATDDHRLIPISCDQDWHRVHLLRESYDAVAVGARTWINDRPRLTVRREVIGREPCQQPARVVFAGGWRCQASPNSRRTFLIGRHPEQSIVHIRSFDHRLEKPLAALDGYGVRSLLVEGGATLLQSFVDQDAYDRLTIYVATSETRLARRSIARTFPWLPALSARSFGRGTLLTHDHRDLKAPAFADCMRRHETHVHELLRGRLSYLKPADSGRDGERIALLGPVALPLEVSGTDGGLPPPRFDWYVFGRVEAGEVIPKVEPANSALVLGQVSRTEAPLVRIHSGCHTGDIFSSLRCDCGAQLDQSLGKISNEGCGIAIYLADQEGRGIGLWAKAAAYLLQEEGADTYEANRRLGCPDDSRRYNDAALVLGNFLDGRRIRLMSNNPAKQRAFEELGFDVVEMCGLAAGHHKLNRGYLEAKARQGHILPDLMRN